MLLTLQLKLKKGHTPSITTVIITVYLKENGNKKNDYLIEAKSCCVLFTTTFFLSKRIALAFVRFERRPKS
jgi:hypothetical protein